MSAWMWFALAGICVLVEILTTALLFASFALAALAAGITNLLFGDTFAQWLVLVVAAVISLGLLRPFASKFIFQKTPLNDTGIEALISKIAVTVEKVTSDSGSIKLKNEIWTAHCDSGVIEAGVAVSVLRIEGAVAIVAAVN